MDFLKTVTGKVVSGIVALVVIAAGISWFQMDPSERSQMLSSTGRVVGWIGVVLVVPWATFFIIRWIAKMDSNRASAALVIAYTLLEAVALFAVLGWNVEGAISWIFVTLGVLVSGVYNVLVCDWIAEKLE